jgi:hypothetical protein
MPNYDDEMQTSWMIAYDDNTVAEQDDSLTGELQELHF